LIGAVLFIVASFFISTGSILARDFAGVIWFTVLTRLPVDFNVFANFIGDYHGFSTSACGYFS